MATAANLGVISGTENITGLTMNDNADWYKFTLETATGAGSEIRLNANKAKDMVISIYDSTGELIGYNASGKDGVSLANLSEGDYFAKITGAESNNYHIAFDIKDAPAITDNRSENYVVLFSGGYVAGNNETFYYDSIKNMYEIATGNYGVDPSHIYILFADGTYYGVDNAVGGNSDMSYADDATVLSATENNLRDVFLTVSNTMDSNDHFLFYSFDHGAESWNGTDYLCGWHEMIEDKNFAEYASYLDRGYQTYLFSQCYSGGILEDMAISDNIFVGSASSHNLPSHTHVNIYTGKAECGFSVSVENGLSSGINNTHDLFSYMLQNHHCAYLDHPQKAGGDFNIFAGETDSNGIISNNGNSTIVNNGIFPGNYLTNKNGSYLPVVTSLDIMDEWIYNDLNYAQIGDTVSVSAKALSLNYDTDIAKVEFYYTDFNGTKHLLAVDNEQADGWQFLWNIDQNIPVGYGVISAVAQDSFGSYGIAKDVDFQILEYNYHPDVTSIEVNSEIYYLGSTVTVSGAVEDVDNNGIDSVRIYLDADKNGIFSYPDEYLGLANVATDRTWHYSFVLDTSLASGNYSIMAEAVDSLDMLTGKAMSVSFNVSDMSVNNFEISSELLQWKNSVGNACTIEISTDNFNNVISFATNGSSVDIINLGTGSYQSRAKLSDVSIWNMPQGLSTSNDNAGSSLFVSNQNGELDLFFANPNGTWTKEYFAQHTGILNGWNGTNEQVSLTGKNKLTDIFEGSTDANILLMTDASNGDALFVDDIYTALPGTVAEQQARIAQIDEIRAGAGDDIVDMTSQRFAYIGDGVKIYGGLGNDTIWANNGNNTLFGDAGNDRLVGGADNDVIAGGIGNDSMHGGGGSDIFCFGNNWGKDTVEQLANGKITLWFESGSENNWNADTLTYTDGTNSVKVSGISADNISLKFGDDNSLFYDELAISGCFDAAASEKIFEDKNKGMLA